MIGRVNAHQILQSSVTPSRDILVFHPSPAQMWQPRYHSLDQMLVRPIECSSHIQLSTDSMIQRLLSHFLLVFRGPLHRREGIVHEAQARQDGHWSGYT